MADEKENVEITAELLADYLQKLCKNTVAIHKVLSDININLSNNLKVSSEILKELKTRTVTPQKINDNPPLSDELEIPELKVIEHPEIIAPQITQPTPPPTPTKPINFEEDIKRQVQEAIKKKNINSAKKEFRCFQQPLDWQGTVADSDKMLSNLKRDV